MSGRRAAENTNTTRPVWLTREHRDALRAFMWASSDGRWQLLAPVVNAWDAAPADPAEAAWDAVENETGLQDYHGHVVTGKTIADAVLVALGLRRQDNPTP